MDNQIATGTEEMKNMVRCCLNVNLSLGDEKRTVLEAEIKRREMRRSVVSKRDLEVGYIIKIEDLDVKRLEQVYQQI